MTGSWNPDPLLVRGLSNAIAKHGTDCIIHVLGLWVVALIRSKLTDIQLSRRRSAVPLYTLHEPAGSGKVMYPAIESLPFIM